MAWYSLFMGVWAYILVAGFFGVIFGAVGIAAYSFLKLIPKFKRNKSIEDKLDNLFFGSLIFLLVGYVTARITGDPTGDVFVDGLLVFAQENVSIGIAGVGAYAIYLHKKLKEIFSLIQHPKEGIHNRLTSIEKTQENINRNLEEIKRELNAQPKRR